MKTNSNFLSRHSLVLGILLMFALTWPIMLANAGLLPIQLPFAVAVSAGWGLSIAALIWTALTQGKGGIVALVKRFLIWRVPARWFVVAFLLYPAIFSAAVLLNAALTQTRVDFSGVLAYKIFGPSANLLPLIIPFFLFDAITNGEEMGWRGYVLPRLQSRHTALVASLILGVIWGFWHLPNLVAQGNTDSLPWFMLKVLVDAVIYTWLYNNTKGSLLLTTILHAAGNTAGAFLPIAITVSAENLNVLIIAIALEFVVAVAVTASAGSVRLSRTEPKQVAVAS